LSLSSSDIHFQGYSFLAHHPVNLDGRHLLAHAAASNFSVARQFSQSELLVFHYVLSSTPVSSPIFMKEKMKSMELNLLQKCPFIVSHYWDSEI
jgi:hypothetical protein